MSGQSSDRFIPNGTGSRTKTYISNNPYGSLERKALKHRRSAGSRGVSEAPPVPSPQIYNPYSPRANSGFTDTIPSRQQHRVPPPPPDGYRQGEEPPPPIPSARVQSHQTPFRPSSSHQQRMDREHYAQNVHQVSRRWYESSQPFQMLDNPYNTPRKAVETLVGQSISNMHIEPIKIDAASASQLPAPPPRRTSGDPCQNDQSNPSSPQQNAFNFFNTLAQHYTVTNNNHTYSKQESVGDDSSSQRSSYSQEESKPYEMKDFYQYSERLRKAKGISGASPKPSEFPPQPVPRSAGSRTPASGMSMQGSRSGSPSYMAGKFAVVAALVGVFVVIVIHFVIYIASLFFLVSYIVYNLYI